MTRLRKLSLFSLYRPYGTSCATVDFTDTRHAIRADESVEDLSPESEFLLFEAICPRTTGAI